MLPQASTEISSRADVDIRREFEWKYAGFSTSVIPLINSNTTTTGTPKMVNAFLAEHCLAGYSKFQGKSRRYNLFAFLCVGKEIPNPHPYIHIDFANGYIQDFLDKVKKTRDSHPYSVIMAGTVATPARCEDVIKAGADIVKIGLGSGSVCRTRNITGVGVPQLSCILECSSTIHRLGGYVCSDGGIKEVGDICKAIGAGADIVMIGGLIAGTNECDNPSEYYGMASGVARQRFGYEAEYSTSEGTYIKTEPRGPVRDVLNSIKGGLRSALSYTGYKSIGEFTGNARFIQV